MRDDLPFPLLSLAPVAPPRTRESARDPVPETAAGSPRGPWLARIAIRTHTRIVIVPVADIVRLEAEDNYVRVWADRPYLHKETLTGLVARLDPQEFLRIHRSHAVNLRLVRELRPQVHGEFLVVLANGTEIVSGRSYRYRIQEAFGLARVHDDS